MEPPGGLPPDRDRQLVLRSQQQQQLVALMPQAKPTLALNLEQQMLSTVTISPPAAVTLTAGPSATAAAYGAPIDTSNPLVRTLSGDAVSTTANSNPALASAAIAISGTTQAATVFSGSTVGVQHYRQPHHQTHHQHPHLTHHLSHHQPPPYAGHNSSSSSSLLGVISSGSSTTSGSGQQQTIEKLSRPMAFDKMETIVRAMQNSADARKAVPVRQQKTFLNNIPSAFMGYDLIEWLMDRLLVEESEALSIANQLCLHGYFFPVSDTKSLAVKDDSSLYRFQTPYYWPWQHKAPDNVEYAIYLAKRSLRNKQRHALEDYEAEALASLHKSLKGKWDFISMQAEEQVRLAKERKKGDKIVSDSQERAYWRVHRPPPGQFTPLEPCPIPSRDRKGSKPNKKKTVEDVQREVDYLRKSLNRTRMKMSQACESLVSYSETFTEYDFFLQPALPSNPWVTEDITFWQLNSSFVDVPTEKRVKRWAISIEELVSDPTGLQEFTSFLEKEYSHENIRFWIAVNRLRHSAHSQVPRKVNDIYEEFLKPGAPCEINIDGKTMESVLKGLKNPSRFTFDSASEHIYTLLLKKDCYPRFVRSDHYKRLLESGIQPSHKKRFFNFGGVSGAKKKMTAALSSQPNLGAAATSKNAGGMGTAMIQAPPPGNLARRRGSDRSLSGSAHELAVIGVNKDITSKVPHSHSQSNLSEIPYSCEAIYRGDMPQLQVTEIAAQATPLGNRESGKSSFRSHQEPSKPKTARLETTVESSSSAVCPWDIPDELPASQAPTLLQPSQVKLSVCPWEQESEPSISTANVAKSTPQRLTSTSSDITDVSDRMQRNLGIRHQNTVDSGEASKRLVPNFSEQRRASMSFTQSRLTEYQFGHTSVSAKTSSTTSPTVGNQSVIDSILPTPAPPLFTQSIATIATATAISSSGGIVSKDPPSTSDMEIEDELNKLAISQRNSESSASEMSALPPPTPTPPPITKVTPPPPEDSVCTSHVPVEITSCESSQSDLLCGAEESGESGNSENGITVVSETEVEVPVQEVQIELIEGVDIEEENSAPPTIQVDSELIPPIAADVDTGQLKPKEIRNKFRLEALAEVLPEIEVAEVDHQRTPTPSQGNYVPEAPELDPELPPVAVKPLDLILSSQIRAHTASDEQPMVVPTIPPPPPPIGPMEEEEQLRLAEEIAAAQDTQEELSPTTDEYQEGLQFDADDKEDYDYDIVDTDTLSGYIPPAPTPAPSMAPLAEMDIDTVDDDEPCEELSALHADAEQSTTSLPVVDIPQALPTIVETVIPASAEECKKRRKKRGADGKRILSVEEKEKASTSAGGVTEGSGGVKTEADRNAVCPWEDENTTASDGTFVKTYATLGYL